MEQSMKINKKILGLFLLLFTAPVLANFYITQDEDYYGNAQTHPFKDAMEGTEIIKPEELAYLNAVDVTRVINRWYFRLYFGNPRMKLSEIENNTSSLFNGYTPGTSEATKYLYNWTLAAGHVWSQWAMELELHFMKQLEFTISPAYYQVPVNSQVKIDQAAAFFNVQYIIPRLFSWYPKRLQIHLDGGLGAALKMADLSLVSINGAPGPTGSRRSVQAAANLGLGGRYQLTTHLLFDVAYRYFFFGKTDIGPAIYASGLAEVEYQSTKFQANGFFLGLVYQV